MVLCVFVMGLCYWHFSGMKVGQLSHMLDFTVPGFIAADDEARSTMHFTNYKHLDTQNFTKYVGGDLAKFSEKTLEKKCKAYFDYMDTAHPLWHVSLFSGQLYDKLLVKKANFFAEGYKKLSKQKKNEGSDPDVFTREDNELLNKNFNDRLSKTMALETEMADTMSVIRAFGHCFYGSESVPDLLQKIYAQYSRKMIPFFHPKLPTFDGTHIPRTTNQFPGKPYFTDGDDLLDYYRNNLNGRGIVISGATRYSRDIIKLIRVLRALNNELPIQIVYRSDLLIKSKQSIMGAGTVDLKDLLSSSYSDIRLLHKVFQELNITVEAEQRGLKFPKQDITFIDVQPALQRLQKADFSGYNNKIIALFFNTFEEVMLFDADTVPMVSPQKMFELKEYQDKGAYFFRDRSLRDSNDWLETNYFSKLMPHKTDDIDMALGIRPVTDHTLRNEYMRGWRHMQEAGLLVLDRKRHFSASLVLFPLLLWGEPVKSSIWGDKEMYWLAMSIAGDEDYAFNKYSAASIGLVTPVNEHKLYNNTISSEVCSSHPGHIYEDGKLLWLNSGFLYCKKNGYLRDQSKFPFSQFGGEVLQKLYEEPLKVRNAIVPPGLPSLRGSDSPPDLKAEIENIMKWKLRKKDVDELPANQIGAYNPHKGWVKSPCCSNYYYCAYNAIQSYNKPGTIDDSGVVFTFSKEDQTMFDILGKVWVTGIKNMMYNHPSNEEVPESKNDGEKSSTKALEPSKDTSNKDGKKDTMSLNEETLDGDSTQETGKAQGTENYSNTRVLDHWGKILLQPSWLWTKEEFPKPDTDSKSLELVLKEGTKVSKESKETGKAADKQMGRVRPEKLTHDVKAALLNLMGPQ